MGLIYLAFANDRNEPLPSLREEEEKILSYLRRREDAGHFRVIHDSFASARKIADTLNRYRDQLLLFHYSGHANTEALFLEDGPAYGKGIAALLAACPLLRLVVLNGCATYEQAMVITQLKNRPAAVFTHAPVGDQTATRFSISFYQSLCEANLSVDAAFNAGSGAAQMVGRDLSPKKNLGFMGKREEVSKLWDVWGESRLSLEWQLPTGHSSAAPQKAVNEVLIDKLLHSLASYEDEVKIVLDRIVTDEEEAANYILDKREAILKAYPYPLSEQLRKLMVPENKNDHHIYYDKISHHRLEQLVVTYRTFVELIGFSLMAQVWDELSAERIAALEPKAQELLKQFFKADFDGRLTFDFWHLIDTLYAFLQKHEVAPFLEELQHLVATYRTDDNFQNACKTLHQLELRINGIAGNPVRDPELEALCLSAEDYLATVLAEFSFTSAYKIVCVKDIGVFNYRHLPEPTYRHKIVWLIQRFVSLAEQSQVRKDFLQNASVMIVKRKGGQQEVLNLTPFVLDENAFDDSAPITKLHYFDRYDQYTQSLSYRHVYSPQDVPLLLRPPQKDQPNSFKVIHAQFDSFCELIFAQPLNAL